MIGMFVIQLGPLLWVLACRSLHLICTDHMSGSSPGHGTDNVPVCSPGHVLSTYIMGDVLPLRGCPLCQGQAAIIDTLLGDCCGGRVGRIRCFIETPSFHPYLNNGSTPLLVMQQSACR